MKKNEVLAIDSLEPGMRVAEAVMDDMGRVLLPAGAELSESTIASLERRGIEAVGVELEVAEDPAELEAWRQRTVAHLDHLFRLAGDGEETRALYRAVSAYRLEQRP